MTLYITGEALIDFVPRANENGETAFIPKPGGSPYNVSLAAARTGCETYFLGNFSHDFFGDHLLNHLQSNNINCSLIERSDLPTTLAFVSYEDGEPRYAFFNKNSTNKNLNPVLERNTISPGSFLHVGSISLIEPPASDRILNLASKLADKVVITIDPNVRANLIDDREKWLREINHLFGLASIIKLSNKDLEFIAPDLAPEEFAHDLLDQKDRMIIITAGEMGCSLFTRNNHISQQVPKVKVKDTVGAGDTLMGTIHSWLINKGISTKDMIQNLDKDQLSEMLEFCTIAAAINCTRSGCNPPYPEEIESFLN
ncbi:MAG: carbohydrate kinase [Rhodobacteraceae bacterium]|nr:carbohydrate kinase [Paracoccaceae bacterium]